MEFTYLVFTRMPGESYSRRLASLLLCPVTSFQRLLTPLCVDSRTQKKNNALEK